jgi:hypothetical protein
MYQEVAEVLLPLRKKSVECGRAFASGSLRLDTASGQQTSASYNYRRCDDPALNTTRFQALPNTIQGVTRLFSNVVIQQCFLYCITIHV